MMSVASVLRDRSVRWNDVLDGYGYAFEAPRAHPAPGELVLKARRLPVYGGPAATVDIAELWMFGDDPDGLGLEQEGCFLVVSGWHGQIGPRDIGAHRLDVDRRKPPGLAIHLHPYGQANSVRVPAAPLCSPEAWVEDIERLISDLEP